MYVALLKAMSDKKVTQRSVATYLGIHYNTVCAKISGRRDFTLEEAQKIHSKWFSEMDFTTLFTVLSARDRTHKEASVHA